MRSTQQLSLIASSSSERLSDTRRKDLGAFYTPPALTDFAVRWAIASPAARVVDPSCGDAAFLLSATERLKLLGAGSAALGDKINGVDLNDDAIATSRLLLDRAGASGATLIRSNFFDVTQRELPPVDAVVGNPPYVRYQLFRDENREAGLKAAAREGVLLPRLTSSWAPFVVHASSFVKPGGKIALVLPGELLHVGYAAAVRDYLLRTYSDLTIITFEEKVFPGALEEVVLVLGTKGGADGQLRVLRLNGLADLKGDPERVLRASRKVTLAPGQRWLTALLEDAAVSAALAVPQAEGFVALGQLCKVDIGVVTGANSFFVVDDKARRLHELPRRVLMKAVSKASHVQGLAFRDEDWHGQAAAGAPAHLVVIDEAKLSDPAVAKYVALGKRQGLPKRYKCRTREPWHLVPYVKKPDLFLTYMSHVAPRLVVNQARATHTNTIHGVFLHDEVLAEPLAVAWLNSATLLSAEIEGRSYGGGVLKMEPGEAVNVLVPRLTAPLVKRLRGELSRIDALVRKQKITEASAVVDEIVFGKASLMAIEPVRAALTSLRARRFARGRTS